MLTITGPVSPPPIIAQAIIPEQNATGTVVTPNGSQFNITGGQLSADQINLFHSFLQFNLNENQTANFISTPEIRNILGRITGGDPSYINGLIQITGSNANLYLMNPAGIIFGPNSTLNIPASFTATTATGIQFNNGYFNATGPNNYNALIGTPSAFAFPLNQPGSIINFGNLNVKSGQNLTFLAGNILNTGTLSTENGTITLTAVPGQNFVRISQPGHLLSLEITPANTEILPNNWTLPIQTLPQLLTGQNIQSANNIITHPDGTIQLTATSTRIPTESGTNIISGNILATNAGEINILGNKIAVLDANINVSGLNGGGKIRIGGDYQGRGLYSAERTFISNNSLLNADAILNGNGGEIIVWANQKTGFYGNLSARGGSQSGNGGFAEVSGKQNLIFRGNANLSAANGTTGTLLLDPVDINITNGSGQLQDPEVFDGQILQGDTPSPFTISEESLQNLSGTTNIFLEATNNITINDLTDNNLSFSAGAGSITFTADADNNGIGNFLMIDAGDTISAPGRNLTINAASITAGNLDTSSTGNGGNIELNATAGDINTGNISSYSQNTIGNSGNGGNIELNATAGDISTGNISSYSLIDTGNTGNSGDGGNITVSAANGSINTTGQINAYSQSDNGIAGNGGNITFTANSNSGIINTNGNKVDAGTTTYRTASQLGNSGDITFEAAGIAGGSTFFYAVSRNEENGIADNTGNGGNIILNARNGNIVTANIETDSTTSLGSSANAGTITLSATGTITTSDIKSNSSGTLSAGSGGDINISADGDISLANIYSNTNSTNSNTRAGNININSNSGSVTITGTIDASASVGNGGNITLTGNATGSQTSNDGVVINGTLQTTGTGSIYIIGTSNTGTTDSPDGVALINNASLSAGGEIKITGTSNATGGEDNAGIFLFGGNTISAGSDINLQGTGGNGTGVNRGMILQGAGTKISSENGSITLNGTGGQNGSGSSNYGIDIFNGVTLETLGIGNITLEGNSGIGTFDNHGIHLNSNVAIQTNTGNIEIKGNSSGTTEQNNPGIKITTNSSVTSTTGNINITGNATSGTTENYGVSISDNSNITTAGNINITGTSINSTGFYLNNSQISSTNGDITTAGNINITGTSTNSNGFYLNNSQISSTGGNITIIGISDAFPGILIDAGQINQNITATGTLTLQADEIDITNSLIGGNGVLQIQPNNPALNITLGGTINDEVLNLNLAELTQFQNGFQEIIIGRSDSSGVISLNSDVSFSDPITLLSPMGAGSINTTGFTLSGSPESDATITLNAAENITTGNITNSGRNVTITSTNGSINTSAGIIDTSSTTIGGNISLTSNNATIITGNLNTSGNTNAGGDISATAAGDITTGDINAFSTTANGGNISLNSNNATITTGNLNTSGGVNGGAVTATAANDITTADINAFSTTADGGKIEITSNNATITTGNLNTLGNTNAGTVTATAANDIKTGDINAYSTTADGGKIEITSNNATITTGNLNTSGGVNGGEIFVDAATQITAGEINSSGINGVGGNVTLDPIGDIQVSWINASGGTTGGNVKIITTAGNFRATGTFNTANGEAASISTAGSSGGGTISIQHGGNGVTPFVVGDATRNGTAGVITRGAGGESTIPLNTSLPYTQSQDGDAIKVISIDAPPPPPPPKPEPPPDPTPPASPPAPDPTPAPPPASPPDPTPSAPPPPASPPDPTPSAPPPPASPPAPSAPPPAPPPPAPPTLPEVSPINQTPDIDPILPPPAPQPKPEPPKLEPPNYPSPFNQQIPPPTEIENESEKMTGINLKPAEKPTQDNAKIETEKKSFALKETTERVGINLAKNSTEIQITPEQIEEKLQFGYVEEAISSIDRLHTKQVGDYTGQSWRINLHTISEIQQPLRNIENQTGTMPVIIYLFSRPEQLDVIVVPPSGKPIHRRISEAPREHLLSVVQEFSLQITQPRYRASTKYLEISQQLYQWIIAPIEADLKALKTDTIMFSMDAGLRSLPMAALYDGKQFLVEKYSLGLIPSVNLIDTRYQSLKDAQVLAFGASEFKNQNPLPAVPVELQMIVGNEEDEEVLRQFKNQIISEKKNQHQIANHSFWPGKSFLNQAFSVENLKAQRNQFPFRIIHLATHAEFQPGDPGNSYIQLWDNQLRLNQMRQLQWKNPPVELLVLSACRTASGDETAELGFAGLAVQAGVKSALASLWYVSDTGTLGLMTEFYRQLQQPDVKIKAEALRRAQVEMIRGQVSVKGGRLVFPGGSQILPGELENLGDMTLQHPYFWSAFTLIGSPW